MVRRLKWIGLSISLLFVVLFGLVVSPKAKAVELNQNVGYLGQITVEPYIQQNGQYSCNFNNSVDVPYMYNNGTSTCTNGITYYMPAMTFNRDYIFEINLYAYEIRDRESIHAYTNTPPTLAMVNRSWQQIIAGEYIGVDIKNVSESSVIISYYFRFPVNGNYNITTELLSLSTQVGLKPNEYLMTSTKMPLWAKENLSVVIDNTGVINAINSMSQTLGQKLEYLDGWLAQIAQNIGNQNQSIQNIENHFDDEKDKAEQQGTDGQNDSNQAGDDVTGATTNLLSAITGFFGAFTSATATTCQTDWGIEGFRNFDFCGTQIPTALRVVFTIVASIIFIPMIWFLINSILSAFKEFQQ